MPLYEEVATKIGEMIDQGTYRPGDRVPSIRDLSRKMRVSINTAIEAYSHLENRGMIKARPQSGFYVCSRAQEPDADPSVRVEPLLASTVRPFPAVLSMVLLVSEKAVDRPLSA